jgi:hypothetical protein
MSGTNAAFFAPFPHGKAAAGLTGGANGAMRRAGVARHGV